MREAITVFEGCRVDLPQGSFGHKASQLLLAVNAGGRAAFVRRRHAVFATDLVGAADVGCVRVEVLPKPYGVETAAEGRQLMFDMLRWAGPEVRPNWLFRGGSKRSGDLLQLVEDRAARELLGQLEVATPRRYEEVQEKSPVLRGRVEFGRYVRQLPPEAHLLPVKYCPLVADNSLGRLLKALATYLRGKTVSYTTRRHLDQCLKTLADVKSEPLTTELVSRVRLGRWEGQWAELVDLADVLAGGLSPDPSGLGGTQQFTLMFPMNRLFESIIRRVLAVELVAPFSCLRSPGEHSLLSLVTPDGRLPALSVRPDLLFHFRDQPIAAGDAKWKRLNNSPPRYSLLPADVYQMLAYMSLVDATTGILFFPRVEWMPENWSAEFAVEPGSGKRIVCLAVDLPALVATTAQSRTSGPGSLATRVQAAFCQIPGNATVAAANDPDATPELG
jgi:5-methylcytosine-specific restriction enzyme subunit McrC